MSVILIIEQKETKEKKGFKTTLEIKNFVQDIFLNKKEDTNNIPLSSSEAIDYLLYDSEDWKVIHRVKEQLNWEY